MMKRLSLLSGILLAVGPLACAPAPALAADYYVCDTTENTGSDANDGSLANPWLTMDKALSEIDALSGGDNLYFCEGFTGSSTADNIIASTGSCDEDTPCAVGIYTPAGQDAGDDGVAPILQNTTYDVLKFDGGILEDGGYSFTGLHLVGDGSVDCVSVVDGFSNLDLVDMEYDSCAIGTDVEVVADQISKKVNVKGATYTDVEDIGYRGSSSGGSLTDVVMNNTGDSASDHAILLLGIDTRDFTLRNINAIDTAHVLVEATWTCSSPVIKGQGSFKGLYFNEVHVNETEGATAPECLGILLDGDYAGEPAHFDYVMFAKVTTAWTGTSGIACSNCTNVYLDHNIVVGDDAITDAIKIPYGSEAITSNYVEAYKNYVVLKDEDTGRTAINITTPKASFTKNQLFVNDADDVCIYAAGTAIYDDNRCHEAIVGGLLDRGIE